MCRQQPCAAVSCLPPTPTTPGAIDHFSFPATYYSTLSHQVHCVETGHFGGGERKLMALVTYLLDKGACAKFEDLLKVDEGANNHLES